MTDTPPPHADGTALHSVPADGDEEAAVREEHHAIPESVRERVLDRDGRCRVSGCRRPAPSDTPNLFVQRIDDDPAHCHPDDPENLVARCLDCACWIRKMPSRDDLPSVLQERLDGTDLDADHIEILRYLHENGPARTGEITDAVDRTSATSVRRVLYGLMARDIRDDAVSGRLVAKDRRADTYGLPWQIPDERDARGVVPLEPHVRRTRILDAVVDRLLDALDQQVANPREVAAAVVDRKPNQTYNMEKRSCAFQFPFEQWAETKRSRHDEAAAIEAIGILAGATDNVSRRRIADPLVEVLEQNDEHELATVLQRSLLEDTDPSFDALSGRSTGGRDIDQPVGASSVDQSSEAPNATPASTGEEPPERTELQVFDDDPSRGHPHSEGHES
jgi:hypothetical protein